MTQKKEPNNLTFTVGIKRTVNLGKFNSVSLTLEKEFYQGKKMDEAFREVCDVVDKELGKRFSEPAPEVEEKKQVSPKDGKKADGKKGQFQTTCKYKGGCGVDIIMKIDDNGKWHPYNRDWSEHRCK